jgi:hypothetical protein
MKVQTVVLVAVLSAIPGLLHAQLDFSLAGKDVQIHGFFTQGYMYSGNNNYLSAKTTSGAFGPTDGGANVSTQITDKFRVGAQVYFFNVGQLGGWHPELDWAVADYKFKDWFGIRGGKVKTTFGLYTDTQDMTFLQTFAMLPQAIYPIDRRDESIAHTGGDVYGTVRISRLGNLAYTGFAGNFADTAHSGYIYSLQGSGIDMKTYGGLNGGGDLRWNTPLSGLVLGASYMRQYPHGDGFCSGGKCAAKNVGGNNAPYWEDVRKDFSTQLYGQYLHGPFRLDAEHRRTNRDHTVWSGGRVAAFDMRAFYVASAYRVAPKVELGSYYSRALIHYTASLTPPSLTHIIDRVLCVRYDVTKSVNLKLEGHFMNGNGIQQVPWGFYPSVNPSGLKDKTPLIVARVGWNF